MNQILIFSNCIVFSSSQSLEERRQQALESLVGVTPIKVKRSNIVKDVISQYQEESILNTRVSVTFDNSSAHGDGVTREMYSLFWDGLCKDFGGAIGHTEFTIPVITSLDIEDYTAIGRIITHQFVQCGTFPIRLSQASVQEMLFGTVDDKVKIHSFLLTLSPQEREVLKNALENTGPFPTSDLIELLQDFNIRQVPCQENLEHLILGIATSEFVTKPYFYLKKLREGMGPFWEGITETEIQSIYELSTPTASRVVNCLYMIALNPEEDKLYRWLQRYISSSNHEVLVNFLRFCTGSDVLLPGLSIGVNVEQISTETARPKSFTCFRKLILPTCYKSLYEMRTDLDRLLLNPGMWDIDD